MDSFLMSAELMRDKELTMLRDENAALKAQVNDAIKGLYEALEWNWLDADAPNISDFLAATLKSPKACLNEHNARIEEEVIERCAVFLNSDDYEGVVMDVKRKYGGDK